jgi:hypothetical protein
VPKLSRKRTLRQAIFIHVILAPLPKEGEIYARTEYGTDQGYGRSLWASYWQSTFDFYYRPVDRKSSR